MVNVMFGSIAFELFCFVQQFSFFFFLIFSARHCSRDIAAVTQHALSIFFLHACNCIVKVGTCMCVLVPKLAHVVNTFLTALIEAYMLWPETQTGNAHITFSVWGNALCVDREPQQAWSTSPENALRLPLTPTCVPGAPRRHACCCPYASGPQVGFKQCCAAVSRS